MLASRHIKREKASLPVDVRRSKASLLKVPNDGREKRTRQLAFELQNSRVFEKRSNSPLEGRQSVSVMYMLLDMMHMM